MKKKNSKKNIKKIKNQIKKNKQIQQEIKKIIPKKQEIKAKNSEQKEDFSEQKTEEKQQEIISQEFPIEMKFIPFQAQEKQPKKTRNLEQLIPETDFSDKNPKTRENIINYDSKNYLSGVYDIEKKFAQDLEENTQRLMQTSRTFNKPIIIQQSDILNQEIFSKNQLKEIRKINPNIIDKEYIKTDIVERKIKSPHEEKYR